MWNLLPINLKYLYFLNYKVAKFIKHVDSTSKIIYFIISPIVYRRVEQCSTRVKIARARRPVSWLALVVDRFVTSPIQPREYNLIIPTSCVWPAGFLYPLVTSSKIPFSLCSAIFRSILNRFEPLASHRETVITRIIIGSTKFNEWSITLVGEKPKRKNKI